MITVFDEITMYVIIAPKWIIHDAGVTVILNRKIFVVDIQSFCEVKFAVVFIFFLKILYIKLISTRYFHATFKNMTTNDKRSLLLKKSYKY
jgi:hypothetical protein